MRVAVVGAGIVGLCSALSLSYRGADVVVFGDGPIPSPRAASNERRQLLHDFYHDSDALVSAMLPATRDFALLWQRIGGDFFEQTGCLLILRSELDPGAQVQRAFDRLAVDYSELTVGEMAERYPQLHLDGAIRGVYRRDGGILKADRILSALTRALIARGVQLEPGMAATAVDLTHANVCLDNGDRYNADRVLLCAGAWTPALLGGSMNASVRRSVVVHATAPTRWCDTWQAGPSIVDCGGDERRYVLAPAGDSSLSLGTSATEPAHADASRLPRANEGVSVLRSFAPSLKDIDSYAVLRTRIVYSLATVDRRWRVATGRRGIALFGCNGHAFKYGAFLGERLAGWATEGALSLPPGTYVDAATDIC